MLERIEQALKNHADEKYRVQWDKEFTRTGSPWFGVRVPNTRIVAQEFYPEIRQLPKKEQLRICDSLLATGYYEHKIIAFKWAYNLKKYYEPSDFKIFSRWIEKHISNWNDCDDFCTHAFGEFLLQFPQFLPQVRKWTKASQWQRRRVAAVSLILAVKRKKYFPDALEVCKVLLEDDQDLVRKGYGWLLKEASPKYQREVFQFVMKNKLKMPRVALRYAIEKMPTALRKKAMAQAD